MTTSPGNIMYLGSKEAIKGEDFDVSTVMSGFAGANALIVKTKADLGAPKNTLSIDGNIGFAVSYNDILRYDGTGTPNYIFSYNTVLAIGKIIP